MTFPILPSNSATGGYQTQRSLRFNSADSTYLNRTPASATNQKTWTWSGWVKLSEITSSSRSLFGANLGGIYVTQGQLLTYFFTSPATNVQTSSVFKDPSSWYHFVIAIDTTQSTAANRIKIYVNSQIQPLINAIYPAQNADLGVNSTNAHTISTTYTPELFNGYLTEVNFIDGQALTPSSFGETNATTGQWQPKRYTGTYGTNGFYLNFSDNSGTTATTLGKDYSGNGNNWTPNNFSVTAGAGNDSLIDVPTNWDDGGNGRGNYCTFNPLALNGGIYGTSTYSATLSNGNLAASYNGVTFCWAYGTLPIYSSGCKFYWELSITLGGASNGWLGVSASSGASSCIYQNNGLIQFGGVTIYTVATYTTGDVIGVTIDTNANEIKFYKNNALQGGAVSISANSALTPLYWPAVWCRLSGDSFIANFGQRPFAYTPPSGFKALNTQNLPSPTIAKGNTQFNPVLFNKSSFPATITGVGFQPDFTWWKSRDVVGSNFVFDVQRGASNFLITNTTAAADTQPNAWVTNSDGWTSASGAFFLNGNYVAWNWKANGAGVTNTAGTITSTVSANTTAGFSVVTYTGNGTGGATIGHGLGVAPSMIIIKNRTNTDYWWVWHTSIAALNVNNTLWLNSNTAATNAYSSFYSTLPSSSVITMAGFDINYNANNYVAYCFAAIPGYSAFGSYTGNGSADGPFVYTGFRPAYVLIKMSSSTGNWVALDKSRLGYNVDNNPLYPNLADAEATTDLIDILSNGFKIRSTDASVNTSSGTYIYAAFAESPFKYANAR